jgi:hypothetical protein
MSFTHTVMLERQRSICAFHEKHRSFVSLEDDGCFGAKHE